MTIRYCDYINGSDITGDGTAGTPYKTIDTASSGLTGGDEVRCAKSPAPTALDGTLAWVNGSTTVNTSVDLTAVLASMSFIRKTTLNAADYDIYWEVSSITASAITLRTTFRGYTKTVASQKLGITDTGTPSAQSTHVQQLMANGVSDASRIIVSGGWNLSGTPTQDGETWFCQTRTVNSYGYGIGLYTNGGSYVTLTKLNFLRYYVGVYVSDASAYITGTYLRGYGYGTSTSYAYAVYVTGATSSSALGHSFSNCTFAGYLTDVFSTNLGTSVTVDTCTFVNGIFVVYGGTVVLSNLTFVSNTAYFYGQSVECFNCNFGNNTIVCGRSKYPVKNQHIYNAIHTGFLSTPAMYAGVLEDAPIATFKHYNAEGNEVALYAYGKITSDTTHARSGTCVAFTPNSTTYYFQHIFPVVANKAVSRTVSAYMKKDAAFNGTVQASLWFMGAKIVDWTTWTLTTDYVQQSITAASNLITENGVLELRVKVLKGTGSTSVYLDDLTYDV